MSQEAVDLKNRGNEEFAAGNFPAAVTWYSKAIELNDKEPTFFTNRAQVRSAACVSPRPLTLPSHPALSPSKSSCPVSPVPLTRLPRRTSRQRPMATPSPMPAKPSS